MTTNPAADTVSAHENGWRTAVLDVYRAQRRYLALLDAEAVDDRDLELAWLALWRAERHRDSLL